MAEIGDKLFIDCGRLGKDDPNYGLAVTCYACGSPHAAFGAARIRDKKITTHVPMCEACLFNDEAQNRVARKYLNAPDMVISEGDKPDATKH